MTNPLTGKEPNAHELLLAMAGRIPDKSLAKVRRLLACAAVGSAITLLADLLAQTPIPLTAAELAAIRTLSADPGALPGTRTVTAAPAPGFAFGSNDESGAATRDELDEALVAAAEARSGDLSGIWRAWRYVRPYSAEASQGDWPSPYRVYLLRVTDPAMIQDVAAGVLGALPESADAGIEIIATSEEPPPYQRAALSASLLLCAAVAEPGFRIARVFDFADPVTGPGFEPGHRVISDPAGITRLAGYLHGGYPALTTALTAHIETQIACGVAVPDVDAGTAISAANFLLHPPAGNQRTAVWFPSGRPADPEPAPRH